MDKDEVSFPWIIQNFKQRELAFLNKVFQQGYMGAFVSAMKIPTKEKQTRHENK